MKIHYLIYIFVIKSIFSQEDVINKNYFDHFDKIDLKSSIIIALKNNPLIQQKSYQKNVYLYKLNQGKSSYYPKLDSIYGYKKNFSQYQKETPTVNKQYYAGIDINQNFYDFGRTSNNVKILDEYYEISLLDLEQQKEEIVFNVIQSYVNILIQNQTLKAAEEYKNYYLRYRDFIKKQLEVGLKTYYELYNVEAELRNAEADYIQYKNQVLLSKVQLFYHMGINENDTDNEFNKKMVHLQIKEIIPEELENIFQKEKIRDLPLENINELYKIALMNRKDYKKQFKEVQIARLTKELNSSEYWPILGASFQHYWNDENYRFNSTNQKNWEMNIYFKIPIFEGFLTKNKVQEAEFLIKESLEKERYLKNSIFLELQTLLAQLQELKEKVEYYKESLQFAKENLNLSEKRYLNGIGNFLELANATSLYYTANKNYYNAFFQFYLKKIEIYKSMGILMDII